MTTNTTTLALDVDIAITDADKWLAEPPTNQCGETCERAKLCATCSWELSVPPQQQPGVPDGWKLVPAEPTPEMISAGERAHWNKERDACSPTPTEFSYDCGGPIGYAWTAMLTAAPQPLTQELLNSIMRNPGETRATAAPALPKCPQCGARYCGNGVQPCVECAAPNAQANARP